jgi:CheY-like chemotaxis protein
MGYSHWHWAVLPDRQIDFLNPSWRECIGRTDADADAEGYGCGRDMKKSRHEESMTATPSLVSVVDDDESVRESLPDLVKEFGFAARAFSSPEEFLASDCIGQTKCLILDIAMPGMSGPDLQRELKLRGHQIPIVFITASTDKTVRPQLLEQGAVECLFKPFSDTALLEALNAALRVN